MREPIVISLGGSVIVPDGINAAYLRRFARFVRRWSRSQRVIVVVGGGTTARDYIQAARRAGVRRTAALHWIGVRACQLNAEIVRAVVGITEPVFTDPAAVARSRARLIVVAPPQAGGTSDFRTVVIARRVGAKTVLNITNVDSVYTADPHRFRDARRLSSMTWRAYHRMFGRRIVPGMHFPLDPIAARAAAKSNAVVLILPRDLRNLDRAMKGKQFRGTTLGDA